MMNFLRNLAWRFLLTKEEAANFNAEVDALWARVISLEKAEKRHLEYIEYLQTSMRIREGEANEFRDRLFKLEARRAKTAKKRRKT